LDQILHTGFHEFEIQSVNVMNEYYVCFFEKEQKKENQRNE